MRADAAAALWQQQLSNSHAETLLVVDENTDPRCLPAVAEHSAAGAMTNRWDIGEALRRLGYRTLVNDYDFSAVPAGRYQHIIYRVSKERAVAHHIINSAARALAADGLLTLLGHKKEGLNSYRARAESRLGAAARIERGPQGYSAVHMRRGATPGPKIDDDDYRRLRPCIDIGGATLFSKPGLYGWRKVDQGSALLMDCFAAALPAVGGRPLALLDLGCGYGYLSARAALSLTERAIDHRITATDNNCAAVAACSKNFQWLQINGEVRADDCAAQLTGPFDIILCNPPFHQGFDTSKALTGRFLQQAARLLTAEGTALFVTNQFIGIEKAASGHFGTVAEIDRRHGFKVLRMTR